MLLFSGIGTKFAVPTPFAFFVSVHIFIRIISERFVLKFPVILYGVVSDVFLTEVAVTFVSE